VSDLLVLYAFHNFANLEQVFQSSKTTKNVFAIMCIAMKMSKSPSPVMMFGVLGWRRHAFLRTDHADALASACACL
jgi:hypothetical protein